MAFEFGMADKFGLKGNVTDQDIKIHVSNNLPKKNDMIFNELENSLTASGDNVFTIDVICKK